MFSTKFVKPRADIDNKGPLKIKPVSIRILILSLLYYIDSSHKFTLGLLKLKLLHVSRILHNFCNSIHCQNTHFFPSVYRGVSVFNQCV